MKLVQSILTKNPCYTAGRKIEVKGLMLHSIGCPQPNASVLISSWNSTSYNSACVHAFIDGNNGTVYQTLPWNHRGWHAGGLANNTHIGIEMCEPACIKYTSGSNFTCSNITSAKASAKRTYEAAVELFAMLCKEYKLDPLADGVIISHREGSARGVASSHVDPEHLWNGLGMGYNMNTFRKAVKDKMGQTSPQVTDTVNTFPKTPFEVRVIINNLNYRSQPSINAKVNGQTGIGTFTITEVKDDWGKLKSGAGWIWLSNPSYCTIGKSTASTSSTKTVDELAKEVLQGKWGNGDERKVKLTTAGYDYNKVQNRVNELLK